MNLNCICNSDPIPEVYPKILNILENGLLKDQFSLYLLILYINKNKRRIATAYASCIPSLDNKIHLGRNSKLHMQFRFLLWLMRIILEGISQIAIAICIPSIDIS